MLLRNWCLVVIVCFLAGCGGSSNSQPEKLDVTSVVGKWKNEDPSKADDILEFKADGTVTWGQASGSYKFVEGTTIEVSMGGKTEQWQLTVGGDNLTVTKLVKMPDQPKDTPASPGEVNNFTRAK
ncbi:MAG: hypothetical protein KatS3mg105_0795 [Gemmatales bacterium]|nr:MAG: hypothetical protein KatS3mg105_0795 [Gemmatales bacterium]